MIIVAGGDSFIWGSELSDSVVMPVSGTPVRHSEKTFFALLSNGHDYSCVAWPGFGNDAIARTVIAQCETSRPDVVLVSWTFPSRYEFRFAYDTLQKTQNWLTITPWTTGQTDDISAEFHTENAWIGILHQQTLDRAKQTGVSEFAESFYRHVGSSEYWETYASLKEIVYLQNYLNVKGIPCLFTCADNSIRYNYTIDHADNTISSLYNQIDWESWFWFPAGTVPHDTQLPRGFYQWAVENKYPMGTTHPLEQAHQDAYQLIQEKFHEVVNQSIQ
jgi:hypothetical protein